MADLSDIQRRLLARFAAESIAAPGEELEWVHWTWRTDRDESPADLEALQSAGLIEVQERGEHNDRWLKLTAAGHEHLPASDT